MLPVALLILTTSCAKEASKKIRSDKLSKGRKLVSILHTTKYFKRGPFGEEFVIEAQLRSLSSKPIKHILVDVLVLDREGRTIAKRRESVSWVKNKRKQKRKKYKKKRVKGYLDPGEKNICRITFYAAQIEPESSKEKGARTINKKFRKPRQKNFTTIFPDKYKLAIYSATVIEN
jgi:hypothetical protein